MKKFNLIDFLLDRIDFLRTLLLLFTPIVRVEWTYLEFRGSAFVADEKEVRLAIDGDLLLEAASFRRLFLHVGARQVAMNEGRFARRQRPNDAQSEVWYGSRQRPFLTVNERICR